MGLKGSQRKYLRGAAHSARPVVQIGKDGVTAGIMAALDTALADHELVKVQFVAIKDRTEKAALVTDLAAGTDSECVGTIGHTAIFFRRHPDPEKRKVKLPD